MRRSALIPLAAALSISVAVWSRAAAPPPPPPVLPVFDPANFHASTVIDNSYLPMTPGDIYVYQGTPQGRGEIDSVVITHDTKMIQSVNCVVVHDIVWAKGALTEDTFDWYAQDRAGNVYMGENSTQYKAGVVTGHEGSWEAGVNGAKPGWVMEAHPKVGDRYRQEYLPGVAEDVGDVLSLTESVTVPYGSWSGNVLRTQDTSALEPTRIENKLYALRVGDVKEEGIKGGTGGSVLVSVSHGATAR